MAEYSGYSINLEYGRLKKIKSFGKGGPVPLELRGLFTSDAEAIKAIDAYLVANPRSIKQNVSAESNS